MNNLRDNLIFAALTVLVSILVLRSLKEAVFDGQQRRQEAIAKDPYITISTDTRGVSRVYDKKTKVIYVTDEDGSFFTPLLNPDGTPMLFEEE